MDEYAPSSALRRDRWKSQRHPATAHFAPLFDFEHLPVGTLRDVSEICANMAELQVGRLDDGQELSAGLRRLLEAKDCFVRQAVIDRGGRT